MSREALSSPRFLTLAGAAALLNIVAGQILHEAGHWLVLTLTGRRPLWGLTSLIQLWDREPLSPDQWSAFTSPSGEDGWLHLGSVPTTDAEWATFLIAGPLAQILAIGVGLVIASKARGFRARSVGLLIALVNAFGQLFYQVVGFIRGGGGDEDLIGHYLDVAWQTVAALFALAAGVGLILTLRKLPKRSTRWMWVGATALGLLPLGPLFAVFNAVIVDQVDAANPLFASVGGFSLPVVGLALLSVVGTILLVRRWPQPKGELQASRA